MLPAKKHDADQVAELATLLNGGAIEDASAHLGLDAAAIVALTENAGLMQRVEAVASTQRRNGDVIRAKSKSILMALLERITVLVESEEMSAATAVKIADVIYKITGLADERAVELRTAAGGPAATPFTININLSGQPIPEVAAIQSTAERIVDGPDIFSKLPSYVTPNSADANRKMRYEE